MRFEYEEDSPEDRVTQLSIVYLKSHIGEPLSGEHKTPTGGDYKNEVHATG